MRWRWTRSARSGRMAISLASSTPRTAMRRPSISRSCRTGRISRLGKSPGPPGRQNAPMLSSRQSSTSSRPRRWISRSERNLRPLSQNARKRAAHRRISDVVRCLRAPGLRARRYMLPDPGRGDHHRGGAVPARDSPFPENEVGSPCSPVNARTGASPVRFVDPFAEDGRADTDMGCPQSDGFFEITAHAHRQPGQPVAFGDLFQERKMQGGRFFDRRNAHQPANREVHLAAGGHKIIRVAGQNARFLRFLPGVDLHEKIRAMANFLRQPGKRLGQLGAIDRVNRLEEVKCLSCLVRLQGSDQMHGDIVESRAEFGPFSSRLLDAVLAKQPMPGLQNRLHTFEGLDLADGDKMAVLFVSPRVGTGLCDALVTFGQSPGSSPQASMKGCNSASYLRQASRRPAWIGWRTCIRLSVRISALDLWKSRQASSHSSPAAATRARACG